MRCGVLHRWLVVPLAAAVLYGGLPALASEPAATSPTPPPAASQAPVQHSPAPPSVRQSDTPAPARDAKPQLAEAGETPHIALLLPLASSAFSKHAEAVRNGFLAAAKVAGGTALPVRTYAVGDDPQQAVETYIKALAAGARVVVGPLTRNGATAVVESAAALVPTLILNTPETRNASMRDIYLLNLQVEAEARQVAQLAFQDGYRRAVTVSGDTPFLKRINQAFVEEFTRLGGVHVADYAYSADQSALARMKQAVTAASADMAFLSLDVARARLARPYLGALPIYATSQVYPGNAGPLAAFDLAGVRFLDMPWLLQPDHAAVMAYPRPDYRESIELERFYALGIDAFRVMQSLLAGKTDVALDGVTGKLSLDPNHNFIRGLAVAQFTDGKLVVRERP
jgi:outer membrane PBP1 activator LpoA protein